MDMLPPVVNIDRRPEMRDAFGRSITYLRVSVTDRCNLRCQYCMGRDVTFLPKAEVLSLEEIERVCAVFIGLGVRKLRLTGGEPLLRPGVVELIGRLGGYRRGDAAPLDELTLTTNGTLLARHAAALHAAITEGSISTERSPSSRSRFTWSITPSMMSVQSDIEGCRL